MKISNNITELIGKTPILKLNKLASKGSAEVYLKLESFNPGGSVKDRIALSMLEVAEEDGLIREGSVIVEPTSGNTGIGLAMIAAARGYKLILVMPETMSMERRNLLKAYGAQLVLTPGDKGMSGALKRATEIVTENPSYFMPQQFANPANPKIHRKTTALEILEQMENKVDAFVAGVGTGGTVTGVGAILKEENSKIKIYAVEPQASPVLSGGAPGPHKIQGIGAGFVPEVLDREVIDEVLTVTNDAAMETTRKLAREEGILVGISSGAAVYAALKVAADLGEGKKVLVIAPDNGERYLSTELFS